MCKTQQNKLNFKTFLTIIIASLLFVVKVNAQISFAPRKDIKIGLSYPKVVCVGDINNDGLNDLIVGTGHYIDTLNDNKIIIYLQDKQGNLLAPIRYPYPLKYDINSICINDVNNDGLNDIIIGLWFSDYIFHSKLMHPFRQ
jgi:hypothetical protein